jgi:hypothetical protein
MSRDNKKKEVGNCSSDFGVRDGGTFWFKICSSIRE